MASIPTDKITIPALLARKAVGPKIVCLTAYDHPTAGILDETGVDLILVGDSLGMVVLGYENTVPVTMDEMLHHTRAVTRAVTRALVVGDMPYFSFHLSAEETVRNASRFLKEGGAAAVKIEGASKKRLKLVEAMVEAEIPVMGHVGLTPQSIHHLGRYRVRGTAAEGARRIVDDARNLERAGAFAVVLESMPVEVAAEVTRAVGIPTIGIGAGPACDGQVLVFHDMLGFSTGYLPKFVRKYADLHAVIRGAVGAYAADVREGRFPDDATSYHLKPEVAAELRPEKVRTPKRGKKI
ncbi:MAG: 3-methyl-2-oxobutanoate hydroxymethyltransferase [Candidatus Aminicenantes bacterium]|nr:3-methyl-2-oxobutanoate hydroxymethyltransferase [Candidatus Aminicenantes bacterium]